MHMEDMRKERGSPCAERNNAGWHGAGPKGFIRPDGHWLVALLAPFLLLAAYEWGEQTAYNLDQFRRQLILGQVRVLAQSLPASWVTRLAFAPEDERNPVYQHVCRILAAHQKRLGCRGIYTCIHRKGSWYFGPESYDRKDPMASRPGDVYQIPGAYLQEALNSRRASVQGPYGDEFGLFVSAAAPVVDPADGRVLVLVGMDMEAQTWGEGLHRKRMQVWLIMLGATTLLLGATWLLLGQRFRGLLFLRPLRGTVREPILVLVAGLCVSWLLVWGVGNRQDQQRTMNAMVRTQERVLLFIQKLNTWLDKQGLVAETTDHNTPSDAFQPWSLPRLDRCSGDSVLVRDASGVGEHALGHLLAGDLPRGYRLCLEQNPPPDMPAGSSLEPTIMGNRSWEVLFPLFPFDTPSWVRVCPSIPQPRTGHLSFGGLLAGTLLSILSALIVLFQNLRRKEQEVAAKVLAEREAFLDATLRSMGDGVVLSDENGVILDVNPAGAALLGMERFRILQLNTRDLFSGSNDAIPDGLDRDLVQDPGRERLVRLGGEGGDALWVVVREWPICAGTNGVGGGIHLFRDITQKHRFEEALKKSEARYRTLVEHANECIFVVCRGYIVFANRKTAEVLDYARTDIGQQPVEVYLHPCDKEMVMSRHLRRVQGGSVENQYQFRILDRRGGVHWLSMNSICIEWEGEKATLNFAIDITRRKKAEEDLLRWRSILDVAFSQSPLAMIVMDEADASICLLNEAAEHMGGGFWVKGMSSDAFNRGWVIRDGEGRVLGPDEYPSGRARNRGEVVQSQELLITSPDGREMRVHNWAAPIRDPSGHLIAVMVLLHDITETRRVDEERRHLEEQIQHQQRLESIGRLTGGIAHDLNNLLAPVLGYGDLLKRDQQLPPKAGHYARQIVDASLKARDLVQQLLAFSRRQVINRRLMDINPLLHNASTLIRGFLSEGVHVVIRTSDTPLWISGDENRLEQVILNLALNARDSMPEGGELSLSTGVITLEGGHCDLMPQVEDLQPGAYACLTVRDTGCGMSPDLLSRIFEPFFTTKEEGKGTGLGLSMAWGIVRQHGGYVRVESHPGEGSVFSVLLPLQEPPPMDAGESWLEG